jgi:phospholipid/cholesterol/gamma-HCH transport system ATP-binding protein
MSSQPQLEPSTGDVPHIEFRKVRMSFGSRRVFDDLSCGFPRGKITVILGGSGSGKSTVLRLIGGLVRPQAGRIIVDGEDITRLSERQMYRVRPKLGMMFQDGALLNSMTIFENLAFPLREHTRNSEAEIVAEVHDRLQSVGLSDIDDLLPGQLSGGMTKRVALARALMMKPVILLCDEPLSGLDPISLRRIESLLLDINERLKMTMVVISHHIRSTMRMAERVLILLPDGAVSGTPQDLQRSEDPRIASFLNFDAPIELATQAVEAEPADGGHGGAR